MNKKKIYNIVAALLTGLLLILSGCSNPIVGGPGSEDELTGTGKLMIRFIIPDYDHELVPDTSESRVISPDTAGVRLILDDEEFMEIPLTFGSEGNTTSSELHGQPLVFTGDIGGVPAGIYTKVTLDLVDSLGNVLTTGTAFEVEVLPEIYTDLLITCVVEDYTWLTPGGDPVGGNVDTGSMTYFKFSAREGDYTISLSASTGTPDIYLFKPNGSPVRDELNDYFYKEGAGDLTYTVVTPGMYIVGIYGWNEPSGFSISVAGDAAILGADDSFVDTAYGDLRDQNWDAAFNAFSQALMVDPSNPEAIIGYSALSLANIIVDPAIVAMATGNLGIIGYPTTMGEALSTAWLDKWVETYEDWDDEDQMYYEYDRVLYLPEISGQAEFDGVFDDADGLINPNEKLLAFGSYVLSNNTGLNDIVYPVFNSLSSKLANALAAIESTNETMELTLSWDMVFDSPEEAFDAGWPLAGSELMSLAMGKAELMAIASFFEIIRAMAYMGCVYSYDLAREDGTSLFDDYYELIYDESGLMDNEGDLGNLTLPDNPFSIEGFLKPTDEAGAYLEDSKAALISGVAYLSESISILKARTDESPFLFTPSTIAGMAGMDQVELESLLSFEQRIAEELGESLINNTLAVVPVPDGLAELDFFLQEGNWPTVIDGVNAMGLSLSVLFQNPLSAIVDLAPTGEPVWYKLVENVGVFAFEPLTMYDIDSFDLSDGTVEYYLRIPDVTLGGTIPWENFPSDNPDTLYGIRDMDWDDYTYPDDDPRTDNGKWDADETIYRIDIERNFDENISGGFPNLDINEIVNYTNYSPEDHYDMSTYTREGLLSWIDNDLTVLDKYATDGAALRAALGEFFVTEGTYYNRWYDAGDYRVYIDWNGSYDDFYCPPVRDGNALFFDMDAYNVWNSITPQGTTAADEYSDIQTSLGSFWYTIMMGMGSDVILEDY